MFFRKMNDRQVFNSKKGLGFGFFTYTFVSGIDYFYYLFTSTGLFPPVFIFWSGLLAFFMFELVLNCKDRVARKNVGN
ncbi:hypothetical protein CSV67_13650 [Sporosarcina sp. P2]|nr:hypothetical protein CSV67_13650 [Sporosarcina sp. P2]